MKKPRRTIFGPIKTRFEEFCKSEAVVIMAVRTWIVRFWQGLVMIQKSFVHYQFPEIREGPGRIRGLGTFFRDKDIDKVLVITGRSTLEEGTIQPALDSLDAAGIDYSVEAFYRSAPIGEDVENAYQAYMDRSRKAILAIGGRARIDCAKLVMAKIRKAELSAPAQKDGEKPKTAGIILVAVPTSAGTGAEASIDATVSDPWTKKRKLIHNQAMLPRYVILDPDLMVKASTEKLALSGMEAICHVVEGYLNYLYCTHYERKIAVEAIKRLQRSLVRAWKDPQNQEAIQDVQYAGMLGARIANRCGHGYTLAMAHAIEQLYDVPHGEAVSIILPAVLSRYKGRGQVRLGDLAAASGLSTVAGEDGAYYLLRWINYLIVDMRLSGKFGALRAGDFDRIIEMTMAEVLPGNPIPEIWETETLRGLLRSLQE